MKGFENMEQWCPGCDKSSREVEGAYVNTIWRCDRCIEEMNLPQPVPQGMASKEFGKMIEEMESHE